MQTARLAVIVVSFNTCSLLHDCLGSVARAAREAAAWLTTDVIVVDNASSDGSAAMVAGDFPDVYLVSLAENLGFTGGNNRALDLMGLRGSPPVLAQPDFVLLLNPDTQVLDDALVQMVRFLQGAPLAGICGAALYDEVGRFQHGAFAFPGATQVALDLLPLASLPFGSRLYESRINGRYARPLWDAGQPFAVDFVLGAALMARAEVVQRLDGLDDNYFMYCEEMDFCLRAAEAGWGVYAVPAAHIVHLEGRSSRQVRWPAFSRLWKSRLRFYSKHRRRFAPGTLPAVRLAVCTAMRVEARRAFSDFASGSLTGDVAGAEISARLAVVRSWSRCDE